MFTRLTVHKHPTIRARRSRSFVCPASLSLPDLSLNILASFIINPSRVSRRPRRSRLQGGCPSFAASKTSRLHYTPATVPLEICCAWAMRKSIHNLPCYQNDYERRARLLIGWSEEQSGNWSGFNFGAPLYYLSLWRSSLLFLLWISQNRNPTGTTKEDAVAAFNAHRTWVCPSYSITHISLLID
jgi:hypothetical protein